jgi:hypothetical protein
MSRTSTPYIETTAFTTRDAGVKALIAVRTQLLLTGAVVYSRMEWPQAGALARGMIFACNPRHPIDSETGQEGFYREYTGQGHRVDGILTWEQAEGDFHAYALAQFDRPQAVD